MEVNSLWSTKNGAPRIREAQSRPQASGAQARVGGGVGGGGASALAGATYGVTTICPGVSAGAGHATAAMSNGV